MSFYEALEQSERSLTPADRRVGSLLLADARNAPFLRAAELAEKAQVHESTVVRFAQKLGYSGFIEMREALRADSLSTMDRTITMRDQGDAFSLAVVIRSQVEVLESLPEKIGQEKVDAVVDVLLAANRIFLIGRGLVLPLVDFTYSKFTSAGLRVSTVTQSGRDRAMRLAQVSAGDVAVFFAFSEEYPRVAGAVGLLKEQGTTVVLLTDEETVMHRNLPEHVIAIPRDRARHGVIVSMTALCYAIHYSLLHHRVEQRKAHSDRVERLLAAETIT